MEKQKIDSKFKEVVQKAVWCTKEMQFIDSRSLLDYLLLETALTYIKLLAIQSLHYHTHQYHFFTELRRFGITPIYAFASDEWWEVNSFHYDFQTQSSMLEELYQRIYELADIFGYTYELMPLGVLLVERAKQPKVERKYEPTYIDDDEDLPF